MSMFTDILGTISQVFQVGLRGVGLKNKPGQSAGAEVLQVVNTTGTVADIEVKNVVASGTVSGTWAGSTIDVAHGGTGQTTLTGSFNALAPTTTKGDLIAHNATTNVRVPVGLDGQLLVVDSTVDAGVKWIDPAAQSGGTVTTIAVNTSNGLTGTSDGDPIIPTLTLGTDVVGLVKADGAGFLAAVAGTDYLSTLTGDVTTSGNAATLATVNTNVGTFGTAANVGTFTVNAKGLVTAASSTAIQIAETQITDGALLARNAGNETITGNWTFNNAVIGVTPTTGSQLTTKDYVDNAIAGLSWKAPVVVATTVAGGNVDLTTGGLLTIDGVTVTDGARVLVKNQTLPAENGVYVAHAGAWVRATDFDQTSPIDEVNSAAVFVSQGTSQSDTGWTQTANVVTIGTDAMNFVQFNGASGIVAGDGLAKTGNVLSVLSAATANITVGPGGVNLAAVTDAGTGSFVKITRDTFGRVSGTTPVVAADITTFTDPLYVAATGGSITGNLAVTGTVTGSNLSGTNTGDQTITLTGDVTGSGTGSFAATIAANTVTNAKLAQMAAHTFKGNNTGATANAIDLTGTQVTAELDVFTSSLKGLTPASGGGTTAFLRADGTWADPSASTGTSRWTAESIDFTFNSGGTSTVQMPTSSVVKDVQVIIDTAFTGDPLVTVSTPSQTFVGSTDTAYDGFPVATVFEIHPGLTASGAAATITVGVTTNGATAGTGRVIVTYAAPL